MFTFCIFGNHFGTAKFSIDLDVFMPQTTFKSNWMPKYFRLTLLKVMSPEHNSPTEQAHLESKLIKHEFYAKVMSAVM